MSHLVCPMCGKLTSLKRFDPSNFERDIRAKKMRGLGRGRGFAVVSSGSILGDKATVSKIRDRLLSLLSMLLRAGLVSQDSVIERLGLAVEEEEPEPVRDVELAEAAEETETRMYEAMDMDTRDIDENDDIAWRLKRAATKLINDYLALRDTVEDYERRYG